MLLKTLKTALFVFTAAGFGHAQIIVDPTPTPTDLVQNVLIGNGVTATNITFTGDPSQIGYFDGSNANLGVPSGIIMSSGNVSDVVPPAQPDGVGFANPGDPDLLTIAQSVTSNPSASSITSTNDAAILEFDFVPVGDSVEFKFVFASEEYLAYVNDVYNDAFGFFISGPGYAGPYAAPAAFPNGADNLALVPGTNEPITISTIYPGLNASYYIDSPNDPTQSFNGHTVPITIKFDVICDSTYHFKFAIADCEDDFLDTGIFLEAESFTADLVQLETTSLYAGSFTDTLLSEGCTSSTLHFIRPSNQNTIEQTVPLIISGTADTLADLNNFTSEVHYNVGQDTVTIIIDPIDDGLSEGTEILEIGFYNITACGDSIYDSVLLYIVDQYPMTWDLDDVLTPCIANTDSVTVSNFQLSIPPFSANWSFGGTNTSDELPSLDISDDTVYHYVTLTDGCGDLFYDSVAYINEQTLTIDAMSMTPSHIYPCDPDGSVVAMVSGVTANVDQPTFNWSGPGAGSSNSIAATVWDDIPPGWYYFYFEDEVCSVNDSIEVEPLDPPTALVSMDPPSGCAPLGVTMSNNSLNADEYYWNFGNGTDAYVNDLSSQYQSYDISSTVMLVAISAGGCSDTTYADIEVITCGCTDPGAINYNPLAQEDDNSCIYPEPIVVAPNIFTPNGDGNNDLFFLDVKYATKLHMTILNRWGHVIYEEDVDFTLPVVYNYGWDGKSGTGEANDGTYFYKYKAEGINGDTIEGHGFLELFRD